MQNPDFLCSQDFLHKAHNRYIFSIFVRSTDRLVVARIGTQEPYLWIGDPELVKPLLDVVNKIVPVVSVGRAEMLQVAIDCLREAGKRED